MMRLVWLSVFLLMLMPSWVSPVEAPSKTTVIEKHNKLLKKYGLKKTGPKQARELQKEKPRRPENSEQQEEQRGFSFADFAEWFKRLSLPIIILIVVLLVVLFYFAFRGSSGLLPSAPVRKPVPGEKEDGDKEEETRPAGGPYQQALELANRGQVGNALVLLHKTSLKILQAIHLVPPGDNFTNNQVKQILRRKQEGENLVNPFGRLAGAAERTVFRAEEPGKEVFSEMKSLYEASFLAREKRL